MDAGRVRLRKLTLEEIGTLLQALPHLPAAWAEPASVSQAALSRMQPHALRAVKVGITRDLDQFHLGLAWASSALLESEGEDRLGSGLEDAVAATDLARRMRAAVGSDLAAFLVDVISAADVPVATLLTSYRTEVDVAIASDDLTAVEEPSSEEARGSDEPLPDAAATHRSVTDDGSSSGVDNALISALLLDAPEIRDRLLRLAEDFGSGVVPGPERLSVMDAVREWVERASGLAAGADLREVAAGLLERSLARQRSIDELTTVREELLKYEANGQQRFVHALLEEFGFGSTAELAAELERLRRPLTPGNASPPAEVDHVVADDGPVEDVAPSDDAAVKEPETPGEDALSTERAVDLPTDVHAVTVDDRDDDDDGQGESGPGPAPDPDGPPTRQPDDIGGSVALQSDASTSQRETLEAESMPGTDSRASASASDESASASDESASASDGSVSAFEGDGPALPVQPNPIPPSSETPPDIPVPPGPLPSTTIAPAIMAPSVNVGDPWDDGTIADLVADERDALAVLTAESMGVEEARLRPLRLFAAAFGVRSDAIVVMTEPELLGDSAIESESHVDENRLLFAAQCRLALELGYSPVGSLERFRVAGALDGGPLLDLSLELVQLTVRGFKRPSEIVDVTALADGWRAAGADARGLLESMPNRSLSYQRASGILHHIVQRNQRLGRVLHDFVELTGRAAAGDLGTDGDWAEVESLARELGDPERVQKLLREADKAVSTSQQLRNAIIASAKERLAGAVAEVAEVLERGATLRRRAGASETAGDPQGMAHLVELARAAQTEMTGTVGDIALQRLARWLTAEAVQPATATSLSQLLADETWPLYEVPRDADGKRIRTELTVDELQVLRSRRPVPAVIDGYLSIGNFQAARQAPASLAAAAQDALADSRLATAERRLTGRVKELTQQTTRVLDRLSSFDQERAHVLGEALRQAEADAGGRFDVTLASVQAIYERGESALEGIRDDLRMRAAQLTTGDTERILQLLDGADEQLAVDYLVLAEGGSPLPALAPPPGDDFGAFFPAVVNAAVESDRQRSIDVMAAVRASLGAPRSPSNRMLREGLAAFTELASAGHATQVTVAGLKKVLRMVGLIATEEHIPSERTPDRHAGYATYVVSAEPRGQSYVPGFGTQALGKYDVTIVWDEQSPKTLMNNVQPHRRSKPNIILYLGTIPVDQRLELRRLTARASFDFSPIVIDLPVIAWISTRGEPSWRLTQRVTLPFTTINPYTPFAGGEVPDEVFVGREKERAEIVDPTGSMFVYGGRQLGKSALLRRVERGLMGQGGRLADASVDTHAAVYLDLKSEGIGEAAPPSALWSALSRKLEKAGLLPEDSGGMANVVVQGIEGWLEADASRRLLLLLDESDNFLTVDSKGDPSDPSAAAGSAGSFPVLQRLKGLMERTGRRFKPVFAGLHQVQRFHDLPNTPVVHGGKDILIGPLTSLDARELVRDPLLALGYAFETDDTMWRLLRLTSYQASLIQIICGALVRHMRTRELPPNGRRIVVTARDVDDVYGEREVRDLIAQRFRWTINLDSRYKMIALVTALRSLDERPGAAFSAAELHDDCETYWPAGFARATLASSEFLRYLREMQGLGVLQSTADDEFGLRSPSILGLIGSRETIEGELIEASEQLVIGYEYNPSLNRRILSQDEAGAEVRSPLPDSDLGELLDRSETAPRLTVVVGTPALGLVQVPPALQRAAQDRGGDTIETADLESLPDRPPGNADHLVVVPPDGGGQHLGAIVDRIRDSVWPRATLVVSVQAFEEAPELHALPTVRLRRWTNAGLRSLGDSLLGSSFEKDELRSITGGWPVLIEQVSKRVSLSTAGDARDMITRDLSEPDGAARFLEQTGVSVEIVRVWVSWFDQGTPASYDDVAAALEVSDAHVVVDALRRRDAVDKTPAGWILDRSVARAAQTLSG